MINYSGLTVAKFHDQTISVSKDIFKNLLYANTNHDVTIFEVDGMLQNIKNWILQISRVEQEYEKITKLYVEDYIFGSFRFSEGNR